MASRAPSICHARDTRGLMVYSATLTGVENLFLKFLVLQAVLVIEASTTATHVGAVD